MYKFLLLLVLVLTISCKTELKEIVPSSSIKASAEYAGQEANKLLDTLNTTMWNAGSSGQHWLEFSLDKGYDIEKMYFVVNTLPAANVNYSILVKKQGETEFKNILSATNFYNSIDSIKYENKESGVEKVRLVLQNDSSWVCLSHASILVK